VKSVEVIIFVENDEAILVGLVFAARKFGERWCCALDNLEGTRTINTPKLKLVFVPWMDLDIILEEDIAVQTLSNQIPTVWTCK
jgi:hypothetical protein